MEFLSFPNQSQTISSTVYLQSFNPTQITQCAQHTSPTGAASVERNAENARSARAPHGEPLEWQVMSRKVWYIAVSQLLIRCS